MKALRFFLLLGFLLGILLPAKALAFAPDWKLVARVKGKVQGQKYNQTESFFIWQSRLMQDGDKAKTLEDSRAKIILADESSVTLGELTQVEIASFKLTPQSRLVKIKLLGGKLRAAVGKFTGKDSNFEVITPNGVLSARGTEFYIQQETGEKKEAPGEEELAQFGGLGSTFMLVFSGIVWANTGMGSFPVFAGQSAQLTPEGLVIINPPSFLPPGTSYADADLAQAPASDGTQQPPSYQAGPFGDTQGPGGDVVPQPTIPAGFGIVNILINPGLGIINLNINSTTSFGILPVMVNPNTGSLPVIIR